MNKISKPQTYYDGTARERELCRNWQPDDPTGDYCGPYDVSWREPLPSCHRRWQHARASARADEKRRAFVELCAAVPLVALATGDELARVALGASNLN